MPGAGDVVEFIAEIAITIVEVDVKKKFGDRNRQNHCHASPHPRLPDRARRGSIHSSGGHVGKLPFQISDTLHWPIYVFNSSKVPGDGRTFLLFRCKSADVDPIACETV